MGSSKQLLDFGGRPMLMGVVDALRGGGVSQITIVVNEVVEAQLHAALPDGLRVVRNDDPASTMIDSIRLGVSACEREVEPSPAGYLVCPCDAAGLLASDVRRCTEAFHQAPDHIIIATYGGRRGHPLVFPAGLIDAVRSPECDAGLNQLARNRADLVREVPCESPGTIANVNTPADYERVRRAKD
jgi:CTP:molybdopterin cytidylyltransferase MocA